MANHKYRGTRNDYMRNSLGFVVDDRADLRGDVVHYKESKRGQPGDFLNIRICNVGRNDTVRPTPKGFILHEKFAPDVISLVAELAGLNVTITDADGNAVTLGSSDDGGVETCDGTQVVML